MHFSLGENFGNVILGIAQENIAKGNFAKGISTFTDSFPGMSEDFALKLLRNEYVILPQNDGTIKCSDDALIRKANIKSIYKWDFIIKSRCAELNSDVECIIDLFKRYDEPYLFNCNFDELLVRKINLDQIILEILEGKTGDEYDKLYDRSLDDENDGEVRAMACITYLYNIFCLRRDTKALISLYEWLSKNQMVGHIEFLEDSVQKALYRLTQFNTRCKYHFGFDYVLQDFKERLFDELENTGLGKEFLNSGHLLRRNILDGYDAGWLSPEGVFYGANGPTSALIHLNLADSIVQFTELKYTSTYGADYDLHLNGWMKIHHDEIYGYFKYDKKDETHELFCPTEAQIKAIAAYADKFYGGKFLNAPSIVGGKEIKTSRLRQADEFQLHAIFMEHY